MGAHRAGNEFRFRELITALEARETILEGGELLVGISAVPAKARSATSLGSLRSTLLVLSSVTPRRTLLWLAM
jgi:hypothetical protein